MLKNSAKFTGKNLCWSLGHEIYNFIKKWLQQRYFLVTFVKCKNIYFVQYLQRLLLNQSVGIRCIFSFLKSVLRRRRRRSIRIIWGWPLSVLKSYLHFWMTMLQIKLQLWEMQAHHSSMCSFILSFFPCVGSKILIECFSLN